MDWAAHDHRPGAAASTAGPPRVHTYWHLHGKSDKVLTCALYRTSAGYLEVRATYAEDEVMRSQVVRTRDVVAAIWKLAVLEKGFTEA